MEFFPNIIGVVRSKITVNQESEYKYSCRAVEQSFKHRHEKQWDRLFCPQDYNSIKLLQKFVDNDNKWVKINDSLEELLSSMYFCGAWEYNFVTIHYDGEDFSLFQIYYDRKKDKYIRINPKIYKEFKKQFKLYRKKELL